MTSTATERSTYPLARKVTAGAITEALGSVTIGILNTYCLLFSSSS